VVRKVSEVERVRQRIEKVRRRIEKTPRSRRVNSERKYFYLHCWFLQKLIPACSAVKRVVCACTIKALLRLY
jgi:hypothetical protein